MSRPCCAALYPASHKHQITLAHRLPVDQPLAWRTGAGGPHRMLGLGAAALTGFGHYLPGGQWAQRAILRHIVASTPGKGIRQRLRPLKRPLPAARFLGDERYTPSLSPGGRNRRAPACRLSGSVRGLSRDMSRRKVTGGRQEKGALKYLSVSITTTL
jgi:hypothetical protein